MSYVFQKMLIEIRSVLGQELRNFSNIYFPILSPHIYFKYSSVFLENINIRVYVRPDGHI